MFFLSSLSLFCSCIYFYMGIYTFNLKKDSILAKLFLIACTGMFIWSFYYGFFYITTGGTKTIFSKISSLGWCYSPAVFLHLSLAFTKSKFIKRNITKYIIYIPGTLFLFIRLFFISSDELTSPMLLDFFYKFNFIYNLTFTTLCFFILLVRTIKTTSIKEKKQAKIILITGLFSYISNIIIEYTLSIYGLKDIPQIGQILNLVVFFGIYYSIVNYELFEISPKALMNNTLSEIMDLFVLVSPEGKILEINKSIENLTQYKISELIGQPLHIILYKKENLDDILKSNFYVNSYSDIKFVTKNNKVIFLDISSFPIVNKKTNELSGILIIGHDTQNLKKFEIEVEKHKKTEQQLRESEERFKIMFYKHTSIMYIFDSESLSILDVNDAATRFYGYSYEELKTMKITEINIFDEATIRSTIKEIYINDTIPYRTKHILSNCTIRDVEIHATPITFNSKNMVFCIINDITERTKNDKYISFLAYHDSLTGLPNRKLFYIKLEQALFDAKVNKRIFAIMYIDLDGFKSINDTYGHQTGDFVLCAVSKKLKHSIRKNDVLARMGGDEFTLLLYDIDNTENAELVVQKLLNKLNKPIIKNNTKFFVNASIGISIYPNNGDDIDSLIKNADHNMYRIKREKKKI